MKWRILLKTIKYLLFFITVTLSCYFNLSNASTDCEPNSKQCVFGVFPHTNFQQLMTTYRSITEDLSLILDTNVKLRSNSTMLGFGNRLKTKAYDIALIGGGQFLNIGVSSGYVPLVTRNGRLAFSLYVLNNSSIKSYDDLTGKTIGLIIEGTTTNLVTKKLFEKNQQTLQTVNKVTLDTQQDCAHALVVGKVDACAFVASILEIIEQQNVSVTFRPIGQSLDILKPIFAVNSRIKPDIQAEIKNYLLNRGPYREVTAEYIQQLKADLLPNN